MDRETHVLQEEVHLEGGCQPARSSSAPPSRNKGGVPSGDVHPSAVAKESDIQLHQTPAVCLAYAHLCGGCRSATEMVDLTAASPLDIIPCLSQSRCLDPSNASASLQWYYDASTYGPPIESDAAGFGAPVFRQAGFQPALTEESMVTESLVGPSLTLRFEGVKDDAGRSEHKQRASYSPVPHGDGFGLPCGATANLLASQHNGRAGGSQESIASEVRELQLSTPSPPSPRGVVQDDVAQDLKDSIESQHVWAGVPCAGTTGTCDNSQGREVVEQLGKSSWSTLSTVAAGGETENPMWGSGQYGGGSSPGTIWTEAAMSGRSWPSLLGSIGERSSLASSQPFPRLPWALDETMLYGDGMEGSRNNPWSDTQGHELESGFAGGTIREPRFESFDFSTAALTHSLQPEQEAAQGEGASSWTLASDGTAVHDAQRGNRMEEGSIGSKRRIWYRAPNGQFASASQVRVGGEGGDGSSNGGGSSRGSEPFRRIRRRRKSEEVERKYRCDFPGCDKAYGTLNHLNTHRATNEHGPRLNAVGYRKAHADWMQRRGAVSDSQQGDVHG